MCLLFWCGFVGLSFHLSLQKYPSLCQSEVGVLRAQTAYQSGWGFHQTHNSGHKPADYVLRWYRTSPQLSDSPTIIDTATWQFQCGTHCRITGQIVSQFRKKGRDITQKQGQREVQKVFLTS